MAENPPDNEASLLAEAVAHLAEGVLITSDDLEWPTPTIVFVNEAMCRISGYEAHELVGKTPALLQDERTDQETLTRLRTELAAERPCQVQLVNVRKDGSAYHAEQFISPVCDASGHRTNFVSVHRDVTERIEAEEAARRAESLQRLTLENISDAVFLTDDEGAFEFICPNVATIFKYEVEDVRALGRISKILGDDLFDPADLQGPEDEVRNIERKVRDRDGQEHHLLINVRRVAINGGTRLYVCRDVTERQQSESARRESERTTQAILASLSAHIAVIDHSGTIVAVNPAWEEFARENEGTSQRCNVGANYLEVCRNATGDWTSGAAQAAEGLQSILDGTAPEFTMEYPCPSATEERWFLLSATPLQSRGGGAVVSHLNITDRMLAEQRLRASEQRYRIFVDQTNDGFYCLDFHPPIPVNRPEDELIRLMYERGFIAECNETYAQMYGYESAAATKGARLKDLHGGRETPENVEALRKFVRDGFHHRHEETVEFKKDGEVVYLTNNSVGIIEDGLYLSCWGTQSNITEQKLAEDARKSLGRILEESHNEIYIFDADSLKFLRVNRGGRLNLGYSMAELRKLTPVDLKPTFTRRAFNTLLQPLRDGSKRELVFETWHERKNGSRYAVEVRLQRTNYRGAPCFVAMILDRTKRRELEQEVINAAEDERQRIANDLHDDLGALLTGVKLRIEAFHAVLRNHESHDAGKAAAIEELMREAITMTRGIARGLRPVGDDPEDLMSALQTLCKRTESAPELRCRLRCTELVLVPDATTANHLFRIAQEAVNNCAKHSRGSRIIVSLAQVGDTIELKVADNGIGFDRGSERTSGLGLHIMDYRARAINGTLHIRRRKKGGTKVTCSVPVPAPR